MKKIFSLISYFVILVQFFIGPLLAQENTTQDSKKIIDEVAWIVGDETILLSDIERQRIFMQQSGLNIEGDPLCIIPEQIAIQKLFLRQAQIDSVEANESVIVQSAEQWITQKINEVGSKEKLQEYLGKNLNEIREERRRAIREEFIVQQMQRKIIENVSVSPSEVNRFYDKVNKDSLPFMPETVEAQIISIRPETSVTEIDKIKAQLRSFTEDIKEGKRDFAFLARLYSQDKATALNGGEMGFVGRAELEPEFAHVAFSLPIGKVSRIVQTKKGYHIMEVIDKRGDLINIRHIMLKPDVSNDDIIKSTNKLDSIVAKINADSLDFGVAARFFSYDDDTRNNNGIMVNNRSSSAGHLSGTTQFQMKDLPPEVALTIEKLQVGDISKPFTMIDKDGNTVVAVAKLRKKNPGHRANVSLDFQVIKDIVLRQKQDETIDKWIKAKQAETFVKINPQWQHCDFMYPGWIKE